jgi:hypothetical protein
VKKKKEKAMTGAKKGQTRKLGNSMRPLFGVTGKKPEADTTPPAKNPAKVRAARMARLAGKRI